MDLKQYWGKQVKIVDIDDTVFTGNVDLYSDKLNDPDERENITLNTGADYFCFYENEIKTIELIKKHTNSKILEVLFYC